MSLLNDASSGDVLLVESIDRLTRLTSNEWKQLKGMINQKGLHVVAVDLPTSHKALDTESGDAVTQGILDAVNSMLVDILATMASKDYEMRRERAAQGIEKAKARGAYKGRQENVERNLGIAKLLESGCTYSEVMKATGASKGTIAKVRRRIDAAVV